MTDFLLRVVRQFCKIALALSQVVNKTSGNSLTAFGGLTPLGRGFCALGSGLSVAGLGAGIGRGRPCLGQVTRWGTGHSPLGSRKTWPEQEQQLLIMSIITRSEQYKILRFGFTVFTLPLLPTYAIICFVNATSRGAEVCAPHIYHYSH